MNNLFKVPKMKIVVISASIVVLLAVVVISVACMNFKGDDDPESESESDVAVMATLSEETEPESESESETETEPIPFDEAGLLFEKNGVGSCTVVGIGTCTKTVISIPEKSPDGLTVTAIATGAFEDCSKIIQIGIPSTVKSIGTGAFVGCRSLTAFVVDSTNTSYCAVGCVLFTKDKTELICYPARRTGASYHLSTNITSIAPYAFEGVSVLEKLIYSGSINRFQEISIGTGNSAFTQMPIEFNYQAKK